MQEEEEFDVQIHSEAEFDWKTFNVANKHWRTQDDVIWLSTRFYPYAPTSFFVAVYYDSTYRTGFTVSLEGATKHHMQGYIAYAQPHYVVDVRDVDKVFRLTFRLENNSVETNACLQWEVGVDMGDYLSRATRGHYHPLPFVHPYPDMHNEVPWRDVPQRTPKWYRDRNKVTLSSTSFQKTMFYSSRNANSTYTSQPKVRYGRLNEDCVLLRMLLHEQETEGANVHVYETGRWNCPYDEGWWSSPDGIIHVNHQRFRDIKFLRDDFTAAGMDIDQVDMSVGTLEIKTSPDSSDISAFHIIQMWFHMICTGYWFCQYLKLNTTTNQLVKMRYYMLPTLKNRLATWAIQAQTFAAKGSSWEEIAHMPPAKEFFREANRIAAVYNQKHARDIPEEYAKEIAAYHTYRCSFNEELVKPQSDWDRILDIVHSADPEHALEEACLRLIAESTRILQQRVNK